MDNTRGETYERPATSIYPTDLDLLIPAHPNIDPTEIAGTGGATRSRIPMGARIAMVALAVLVYMVVVTTVVRPWIIRSLLLHKWSGLGIYVAAASLAAVAAFAWFAFLCGQMALVRVPESDRERRRWHRVRLWVAIAATAVASVGVNGVPRNGASRWVERLIADNGYEAGNAIAAASVTALFALLPTAGLAMVLSMWATNGRELGLRRRARTLASIVIFGAWVLLVALVGWAVGKP